MKRESMIIVVVVVLSTFLLSNCAPVISVVEAKSSLPRLQIQETSPSDQNELVNGNSSFAFDFYHQIHLQEGNIVFSPFSLSIALAMTYAGARGETQQQMARTLYFTLSNERLHPAFNALDLTLSSRGQDPNIEGEQFKLSIANSLWGQKDYVFLPEFLDLLAQNYGAGLRLVDFKKDPEAARQAINSWVRKETQDKIKDIIPPGIIDEMTRLALANAIYFKADWLVPFVKDITQEMPFKLLDGSQVYVPMMSHHSSKTFPYYAGAGFQVIELPYVGETTSMLVIVPDEDQFSKIESELGLTFLEEVFSSIQPQMVSLKFPKFRFESQYELKDTLSQMGMEEAFTPFRADFSGMDGTFDLYIDDIVHKALVAVDEKGTEAAAATVVIMGVTSAPPSEIQLVVDRPFIFLILDRPTRTILFLGRVMNPLES